MTDIISRAQELVKLRASMDKSSIREVLTRETEENMFAQTLIEALAEETWEYGVEYTGINHGNRHIQWCYGEYDETSFDEAQWEYEKMLKRDMKPRMVRRRVSPKEYIEFGAPGSKEATNG